MKKIMYKLYFICNIFFLLNLFLNQSGCAKKKKFTENNNKILKEKKEINVLNLYNDPLFDLYFTLSEESLGDGDKLIEEKKLDLSAEFSPFIGLEDWRKIMSDKGVAIIQEIYKLSKDEEGQKILKNPQSFTEHFKNTEDENLKMDFSTYLQPHIKSRKDPNKKFTIDNVSNMEIEKIRLDYLTIIASISHAIHKTSNSGQVSGAYGINEIEHNRALQFIFYRYALFSQLENNERIASIADADLLQNLMSSSHNQFAYTRTPKNDSSHLRDPKLKREQVGIDMRVSRNKNALPILPLDGRGHILMGSYVPEENVPNNRQMYIKFETYGLGILSEHALHGWRYIKSINPLASPSTLTFREDEIPNEFRDILTKYGYKFEDKQPLSLFIEETFLKLEDNKKVDFEAGLLDAEKALTQRLNPFGINNTINLTDDELEASFKSRIGNEVKLNYNDFATRYGLPKPPPELDTTTKLDTNTKGDTPHPNKMRTINRIKVP